MGENRCHAARLRDIHPQCVLHLIPEKYEPAHRERFFTVSYDYIVDAIDLVSCKLDLIETALARGIPILSAMGTGNKLDPSQFRVADISKTEDAPGPGHPKGAEETGDSPPQGGFFPRTPR